jgi:general secretion pathway protein G
MVTTFNGERWLRQRHESGFTLFELVMVMTIIVILAAITTVAYQQLHLKAKESTMAENLKVMRRAIDSYIADKEALPQSLDDLVTAAYMDKVPVDPITGEADWQVETGEDTFSVDGGQGIVNVRSKAPGAGSDGVAYSDY